MSLKHFHEAMERQMAIARLDMLRMLSRTIWGDGQPPLTEDDIQAEIQRMRDYVPPPPLQLCEVRVPENTGARMLAACR